MKSNCVEGARRAPPRPLRGTCAHYVLGGVRPRAGAQAGGARGGRRARIHKLTGPPAQRARAAVPQRPAQLEDDAQCSGEGGARAVLARHPATRAQKTTKNMLCRRMQAVFHKMALSPAPESQAKAAVKSAGARSAGALGSCCALVALSGARSIACRPQHLPNTLITYITSFVRQQPRRTAPHRPAVAARRPLSPRRR